MTPLAADVSVKVLQSIARALDVPVRVASIVLLLVLVLELGRSLTELLRRHRRDRPRLADLGAAALAQPERAAELAHGAPSSLAERAIGDMASSAGTPSGLERALAQYELGVQRRLDRTRVLVRAGPAVGLMGTLIPLGPGVAALGRGDVASLAADLRTAFAATVVGILVGTIAFALTLVRTRVYSEDLAALESVAESAIPRTEVP